MNEIGWVFIYIFAFGLSEIIIKKFLKKEFYYYLYLFFIFILGVIFLNYHQIF